MTNNRFHYNWIDIYNVLLDQHHIAACICILGSIEKSVLRSQGSDLDIEMSSDILSYSCFSNMIFL